MEKMEEGDQAAEAAAACDVQLRQETPRDASESPSGNDAGHQDLPCQRRQEPDLNKLDCCTQTDSHIMISGMVPMEPDMRARLQRQRSQLRAWLNQQQSERTVKQNRQKLDKLLYDQYVINVDSKALQLDKNEVQMRRAAAFATKDYNLALARICDERAGPGARDHLQAKAPVTVGCNYPSLKVVPLPESLEKIIQFQKHQIEEGKRRDFEKRKAEEQHDHDLIEAARRALLIERHQSRITRQIRQDMDTTNFSLAESHRQRQIPCFDWGHIDESIYSKFSTSRR